mmetsp:Transcript_22973/g.73881  ORF Transcript_22973/g.73881 Transcript_22973/m.73881 type:complete len:237 (-) Transcript_22973:1172-1882(-)
MPKNSSLSSTTARTRRRCLRRRTTKETGKGAATSTSTPSPTSRTTTPGPTTSSHHHQTHSRWSDVTAAPSPPSPPTPPASRRTPPPFADRATPLQRPSRRAGPSADAARDDRSISIDLLLSLLPSMLPLADWEPRNRTHSLTHFWVVGKNRTRAVSMNAFLRPPFAPLRSAPLHRDIVCVPRRRMSHSQGPFVATHSSRFTLVLLLFDRESLTSISIIRRSDHPRIVAPSELKTEN